MIEKGTMKVVKSVYNNSYSLAVLQYVSFYK